MSGVAIIPRNVHGDLKAQALANAFQLHLRVPDPDFALLQDPDIYDKIMRDTVVADVVEQRTHKVAGRTWNILPAGESTVDALAARIIEELIDKIFKFKDSMLNLSIAAIRGIAFGFIEGRRRPLNVADKGIKFWWIPNRVKDISKYRWRQIRVPAEKNKIKLVWELFDLDSRAWKRVDSTLQVIRHIYEDSEERLGYGRPIVESIYYYHYAKVIAMTEGLAGLEKWAQGFITVGIDNARNASTLKQNKDIADEWLDVLEIQRSRHALVHDKTDEIKVIDGPGQGWQIVQWFIEYLDQAITRRILGATLPSGGTEGGSFALGKVQENTIDSVIHFDRATLSETITRDLIGCLWFKNRPQLASLGITDANKPKFEIGQEKAADPRSSLDIIGGLLDRGVNLIAQEVYEKTGFTMPDSKDIVIEGQAKGAPAAPGFPFTLENFTEFAACKKGETSAKTGCTPAEVAPKEPPTDKPKGKPIAEFTPAQQNRLIKQQANEELNAIIDDREPDEIEIPTIDEAERFKVLQSKLKEQLKDISRIKDISERKEAREGFKQNAERKEFLVVKKKLSVFDKAFPGLIERKTGVIGFSLSMDKEEAKPFPFPFDYEQGGPCKKGETAAKTGCTPAEGDGAKQSGIPNTEAKLDNVTTRLSELSNKKKLSSKEQKEGQELLSEKQGLMETLFEKKLEQLRNARQFWSEQSEGILKDIDSWTRGGYDDIRKYQKGDLESLMEPEALVKERTEKLKEVFDKAPKFEGTVYRGIQNLRSGSLQKILDAEEVEFDAFTSTSHDAKIAANDFGRRPPAVVFKMKQHSGVSIETASKFQTEREVLMKQGTKFKVVSKTKLEETINGERWEITLEEVA